VLVGQVGSWEDSKQKLEAEGHLGTRAAPYATVARRTTLSWNRRIVLSETKQKLAEVSDPKRFQRQPGQSA
jgi:hypothetical protein